VLPKVSVIIPVYNHDKYIKECVDSVLAQDYKNLEVIVVDDGSTDETPYILENFGKAIRYVRQENRGAASALNHGLRIAEGDLVAWLSSDDVYLPQKISKQVAKFIEDPTLSLVYTDWLMIDAYGNKIRTVCSPYPNPKDFILEVLKANFINGSSILMKKEKCVDVNYFDENLVVDVDADMWFRLLKQGCKFGHVSTPLLKYRWHAGNQSHNFTLMQKYKDLVRLRVLQTCSYEEIFGLQSEKVRTKIQNYERLAWILALDGHVNAAQYALDLAVSIGRLSLAGRILKPFLKTFEPQSLQRLFHLPRFLFQCRSRKVNPVLHIAGRLIKNA